MNPSLSHFLKNLHGFPTFNDEELIGVNTRAQSKDTPLHYAAIQGNSEVLNLLLDAGADIDAHGEDGFTALHYAVEQQQFEIVKILLNRGCDPLLRDDCYDETAAELAASIPDDLKRKLILCALLNT